MSKNVDQLPEGGWGIKLMSQLSDHLSYISTPDQRNCLLIVKNYEVKGLNQSPYLQKASILERGIEYFKPMNGLKYPSQQQTICDNPLQKFYLQVRTDLKELDQVLQWFNQLRHLPISQTVLMQCQLILAEGFTNAVRHAHRGLSWQTPIELEIAVFHERVEMKIWDYGQA
ncbi:ATP-binding protein, partial [Allocoleopsis sp.]|uniref:ATP-binding protein n=1 Tax=Allocoleopsis sp. TaxID=3088169 RepID=UPI002FD0A16A